MSLLGSDHRIQAGDNVRIIPGPRIIQNLDSIESGAWCYSYHVAGVVECRNDTTDVGPVPGIILRRFCVGKARRTNDQVSDTGKSW